MTTIELVTCSYAPDAELCERLVASVDRHVPASIPHTILVPRRDLPKFRHLSGPRTRILAEDEVLSRSVRRVPFQPKALLYGVTPVRSWLLQQLVKLSAPRVVDADVLVIIDSDTAFCRPFDETLILRDGRVRLFADEAHAAITPHVEWHENSARLLGIPPRRWFGANYVSHLVVWRRDVLCETLERVTSCSAAPWDKAIARTWHFSEYTLYGIFAQHVVDDDRHWASGEDLAHSSWNYDVESASGLRAFRDDFRPHHVALGVQSKTALSLERHEQLQSWFASHARESDPPVARTQSRRGRAVGGEVP